MIDGVEVRDLLLALHVGSGTAALLLGGAVLARGAAQDWTGRAGRAYVVAVCVVAATALGLVGPGSALPIAVRVVLGVVAVLTALAAVAGAHLAASAGHRAGHLRAMWASATSLVSAVAVVSAPVPVWIAVVVAATALTEGAYRRACRAPLTS